MKINILSATNAVSTTWDEICCLDDYTDILHESGSTLLTQAVIEDNQSVALKLLTHISPNSTGKFGKEYDLPLDHVVSVQMTRILLVHGARPDGIPMCRPLFTALRDSKFDIAQLLIDHGADVNLANNEGKTPLMYVCSLKKRDAVEFLLKNGARFDIRDRLGRTCLFFCRELGTWDILKHLGADINVKDYDNTPLLHALAAKGCKDIVRIYGDEEANRLLNANNNPKIYEEILGTYHRYTLDAHMRAFTKDRDISHILHILTSEDEECFPHCIQLFHSELWKMDDSSELDEELCMKVFSQIVALVIKFKYTSLDDVALVIENMCRLFDEDKIRPLVSMLVVIVDESKQTLLEIALKEELHLTFVVLIRCGAKLMEATVKEKEIPCLHD